MIGRTDCKPYFAASIPNHGVLKISWTMKDLLCLQNFSHPFNLLVIQQSSKRDIPFLLTPCILNCSFRCRGQTEQSGYNSFKRPCPNQLSFHKNVFLPLPILNSMFITKFSQNFLMSFLILTPKEEFTGLVHHHIFDLLPSSRKHYFQYYLLCLHPSLRNNAHQF